MRTRAALPFPVTTGSQREADGGEPHRVRTECPPGCRAIGLGAQLAVQKRRLDGTPITNSGYPSIELARRAPK